MHRVLITGTDTGVGKTFVASAMVRSLSDFGLRVGVCKPVESGHVESGEGRSIPADARRLAEAARQAPDSDLVPYVFAEALAPLYAARLAGVDIDPQRIRSACENRSKGCDLLLVEGAGGLAVPYTKNWAMSELALEYEMSVVIVSRPDLGTLNHTLLTVEYALRRGLRVLGVLMNNQPPSEQQDLAQQMNGSSLEELCQVPILGTISQSSMADCVSSTAQEFSQKISPEKLLQQLGALK